MNDKKPDSLEGKAFEPRENVYTCPVCGGHTSTVDVDEGVTPMFLRCRATGREGDCEGMAVSAMYPKGPRPAHIPEPAWEWFKPTGAGYKNLSPEMKDHVDRGGLDIRKRGTPNGANAPSLRGARWYRLKHVPDLWKQGKGFTDGRGLDYAVAPDGSLRALNKPRSRRKRLREERAAKK